MIIRKLGKKYLKAIDKELAWEETIWIRADKDAQFSFSKIKGEKIMKNNWVSSHMGKILTPRVGLMIQQSICWTQRPINSWSYSKSLDAVPERIITGYSVIWV